MIQGDPAARTTRGRRMVSGPVRFDGVVLMVGLTGGIGSGKSVVARRLATHGALVIDADVLAREVVAAGTGGFAAVVEAFGAGVVGGDGELDRVALGRRVFGDTRARQRLEAIIHPRVRARTLELAAAAAPGSVVVNDVPLLVEAGLAGGYHLVIVVLADAGVRRRRLAEDRGMPEDEARARIAAQATDEQRRAAADILITNDGSLEDLHAEVDRVWATRLAPYATRPTEARAAAHAAGGRS